MLRPVVGSPNATKAPAANNMHHVLCEIVHFGSLFCHIELSWALGQESAIANPWILKMEQFTRFSKEERQTLDQLVSDRQMQHAAGEDIVREGDHSPDCHVVLSGLACRYKILPDGERQIMAFLVPGDLCDAEIFILKEMDHSVGALAPTTTAAATAVNRFQVMVVLWPIRHLVLRCPRGGGD